MDLIYAARYTEVCDYKWKDWNESKTIPEGIWHVDTAAIPEFFETIQLPVNRSREYVVVSPSCDFGVCLQRYNHPAYDFEKWVGLQVNHKIGYRDIALPPRINPNRCRESDKYSIKCWSYTETTFNEIPKNVKRWFLSNCEIDEHNVTAIPFGIFGNKDKLETANAILNYNKKLNRHGTLYVNFQFYTTDRFRLFQHFDHYFKNTLCEREIPFEQYLDRLATHKFVLCPPSNGYDSYRVLETIYMGAIPIIDSRLGCISPYYKLQYPILAYPNLFMVNPLDLDKTYDNIMECWSGNINLEKVLWPYWENEIKSARSSMVEQGTLTS